jgi:hypothetical protein
VIAFRSRYHPDPVSRSINQSRFFQPITNTRSAGSTLVIGFPGKPPAVQVAEVSEYTKYPFSSSQ